MSAASRDDKYLKILIDKINICSKYKPKFGQGEAISYEQFQKLYGSDRFYSWFGLDHPLMYAAHKAAGGITSLYRQIGTGCERLVREIIKDQLGLTTEDAKWSYTMETNTGRTRKLSLDARIPLGSIEDSTKRATVEAWLRRAAEHTDTDEDIARVLKGAVFEVRQGYKSKDSKRQNADIGNAGTAYAHGYLPVVALLSDQIDSDVADRYAQAGWLLLRGRIGTSDLDSLYDFSAEVLGYDLAGFFERNSETLKATVDEVLRALLSPNDEE